MLLLAVDNRAHGQFAEPCRAPIPSTIQGGGASGGKGFVELVPSICVSERYDSNVFFRAATPGLDRADYVTSVNPTLTVNHNGGYAAGYVEAGGTSETYVNNSGLNFLGSNGTLFLNLDNTVKRILPNAALLITDAVNYAPTPPGFVNPVAGTNPGAPANIQDVFAQGILFSRTSRIANRGSITATYATTASTKVMMSYGHSMLRFLSGTSTLPGAGLGGLFDTTTHTGNVGAFAQVTGVDQLNVKYSHMHTDFSNGPALAGTFKTHTATVGWSRILTSNVSAEVSGGGLVFENGRTTYAADAALIMGFASTRATLSYARSAFPSFSGVPTQIVGDVVSLSAVQQLSPQWQLNGGANYSHSSGGRGAGSIKYDSYGGSVNLAYLVARFWTTALSYNYQRFDQEFGTTRNQFDRHVCMLSVRVSWE